MNLNFDTIKELYNVYVFGSSLRKTLRLGDKVLEIGCGENSLIMRSGLIKQLFVTGVDIYEPYIKLHKTHGLYANLILGDVSQLEFKEDEFDVVVCMDVLEHLSKKSGGELLIKMKKWGKKVIITTPNGYVIGSHNNGNEYQQHLSGWNTTELKLYGYKVRGLSGLKQLRKSNSQLAHDNLLLFWGGLSLISDLLVYFIPNLAFHLLATYKKK